MKIEERKATILYNDVRSYMLTHKDEIKLKYFKKEHKLSSNANEEVYDERGYGEIKNNGKTYTLLINRHHKKDDDKIVCASPSFHIELCTVFNGELFTMWEMETEKTDFYYLSKATSSDFPFELIDKTTVKNNEDEDSNEIKEVY